MTSQMASRGSRIFVDVDGVVGERGYGFVAGVGDGEDVGALLAHVAHELQDFLVALDGVGIGVVYGGDHDQGRAFGDEGVGAVLQLAAGVAFGVEVGGLLELERAFAGDGVVDAAAEEEEVLGVAVLVGDAMHGLFPAAELGFDLAGEGGDFGEALLELGGVHEVARHGAHESEEIEIQELRGEALGGGDGALAAGDGGEGGGGFARHGGVVDVGDGEGFVAGERWPCAGRRACRRSRRIAR